MKISKPEPVDWSVLPPLWERRPSYDNRPGTHDSATLVFKHPNGTELLSIRYTDEIFACIFSPRQAHAIMWAIAGMFNDCNPTAEGDSHAKG